MLARAQPLVTPLRLLLLQLLHPLQQAKTYPSSTAQLDGHWR
jgi:hypothetical protein